MWCQFAVKFRMQYQLDYLMVAARYINGSMHVCVMVDLVMLYVAERTRF